MNLETKITIYKFTPQLFTLTQKDRLFVNNTRRKSVITGTGTNSNMRMTTSFILKTLEKTFLWMKLA